MRSKDRRPNEVDPDRSYSRWVLLVGTIILLLIAIGAGRIATDRSSSPETSGDTRPHAQAQATSTAAEPEPLAVLEPQPNRLEDVSFVDIGTGRATPLPRSIRSIPGARKFAVSPRGGRLAFEAEGSVYVARIDGSRMREVSTGEGATPPSWSPDGRRIVCTSRFFSNRSTLFVIDLRTPATERIVVPGDEIWHPNFSPDGRTILFTMHQGNGLALWTVPAMGGEATPLVRLPSGHHRAAFGTYGPDGLIAYRRTSYDGEDTTEMTEARLWVARTDGSHRRALPRGRGTWMSQGDAEALWPSWSPDGSKIAFEKLYGSGVYVMDVDTGAKTLLGSGTNPAWVDDRTMIIEGYLPKR